MPIEVNDFTYTYKKHPYRCLLLGFGNIASVPRNTASLLGEGDTPFVLNARLVIALAQEIYTQCYEKAKRTLW